MKEKQNKEAYRYTIADLKFRQSLPLEYKIRWAKEAIRTFYEKLDGNCYVSISGGLDSEVLLSLARRIYPDIEAVFVKTGLDHKSARNLALLHENVTDLNPVKSHYEILREYGYPIISKEVSTAVWGARHGKNEDTRQHYRNRFLGLSDDGKEDAFRKANYGRYGFLLEAPFESSSYCCYFLKESACREFERATGKYPITGILAEESQRRTNGWLKTGCNSFSKGSIMSNPLSTWTKKDIMQYLYENEKELMKNLEREALLKGMSLEELHMQYPHPWAQDYGDIIPIFSDKQIDGQINMFATTEEEVCNCKGYKTSGCDRTGCLYCLYGAQCRGDRRLLLLKEAEPDLYDFIMRGGEFNEKGMWIPNKEGLGFKFVIDYLNQHGLQILY